MLDFKKIEELFLELVHLFDGNFAEQSVGSAEDDGDLLLDGHGGVLGLFEQLHVLASFVDDGKGIYTIPEIPQERKVDMNANTYELEKVMQGKE